MERSSTIPTSPPGISSGTRPTRRSAPCARSVRSCDWGEHRSARAAPARGWVSTPTRSWPSSAPVPDADGRPAQLDAGRRVEHDLPRLFRAPGNHDLARRPPRQRSAWAAGPAVQPAHDVACTVPGVRLRRVLATVLAYKTSADLHV